MSTRAARVALTLSIVVLIGVVAAWASWPNDGGRADLQAVAAVPISTTEHASTTDQAETTTTTPPTTATPATEAPPAVNGGQVPDRLRIPSLGVDARVVPVGLEPDRQMEIPPAADVGWYELGPRPGDGGSAVLAAHVDYGGQRGAFFDLHAIPVGTEVFVDGPGGTQRFTVTIREQVAKADVQLERYFTLEGAPRISLITCGGAFSRSSGHYEDNVIITATPAV